VPTAGKILELLAKEKDIVSVGQDLFMIEPGEGGGKPRVTHVTRSFTSHFLMFLASAVPEEQNIDLEEPKDQ
jgi:2-oxoglutarate dehydrogenase E2 component (dihydrolipoamide succinyltransferase)